jgi:HD-like signal output (HDOD) protein
MVMALVEVEAGDYESAIGRYEYLISIPCDIFTEVLRAWPFPDEMVNHPRFQALLAKGDKVF